MKATEILKLAEMIASKKEDKPMRQRNRRPPRMNFTERMNDLDVANLLQKRLAEADALKKILDDRQKANEKKEEKKKNEITLYHVAMGLVATYPIIGLVLWVLWPK